MAEDRAEDQAAWHFRPIAKPFALAGVYDIWKGGGGKATTSFAIVTTAAAPSTVAYHDRMPLVLEDRQFRLDARPPELAAGMMKPYGGAIDIWRSRPTSATSATIAPT